jgi:hypothetical protein
MDYPHTCPDTPREGCHTGCGSSNTFQREDQPDLRECIDCGIWWCPKDEAALPPLNRHQTTTPKE